MRLYQTKDGVFIKRFGKAYLYVGDAFVEVPILTAKKISKLREKIAKVQDES